MVTASVGDPAGTPRPFVVLRSDHFAEHALVILVAFSTTPNETPTLRVLVEASADKELRETSLAMIDRIVSVHMERVGDKNGVPNIMHGSHFVLVDRALRIRGYYDMNDADAVARVLRDAAIVSKEPAR